MSISPPVDVMSLIGLCHISSMIFQHFFKMFIHVHPIFFHIFPYFSIYFPIFFHIFSHIFRPNFHSELPDFSTGAKLHAYNSGQVVIHAVGPKLRDLLKGVQGLSRTYLNVLSEYCQAVERYGDGNGKMMENDGL